MFLSFLVFLRPEAVVCWRVVFFFFFFFFGSGGSLR
jgi:hypothetical protein